jgi:hypothetical protein
MRGNSHSPITVCFSKMNRSVVPARATGVASTRHRERAPGDGGVCFSAQLVRGRRLLELRRGMEEAHAPPVLDRWRYRCSAHCGSSVWMYGAGGTSCAPTVWTPPSVTTDTHTVKATSAALHPRACGQALMNTKCLPLKTSGSHKRLPRVVRATRNTAQHVFAGWASPSSHGLWGGDTLLLSSKVGRVRPPKG